jgi:hypothetical protein
VVQHLPHRHFQRSGPSLHDHAERVTHEQSVDSRSVEELGEGIVVTGEDGESFAAALRGTEGSAGVGEGMAGLGKLPVF